MKRLVASFLLAGFLLAGTGGLFAQTAADPNDRLYADLSLWRDRGLIESLPPLRPYPIQLVRRLLAEVQAVGTQEDEELAAWYLSGLEDPWSFHLLAEAHGRTRGKGLYKDIDILATYQGSLLPQLTYSGSLGVIAIDGSGNEGLPKYQRTELDFILDNAVRSFGSSGLTPRVSSMGSVALGTENVYFQAGILRGSFGPFWGDSAVLSPSSPQAGQFSFVIHQGFFTYTQLLMDVSATDNAGGSLQPDKYLALQSVELQVLDWLTLGLFETTVWGGRFEPLYLLPFPAVLYYAQGLIGFPDNSFIGVSASVKFPQDLKADLLLYVDDAGFNELVRLRPDAMLVLSMQTGVSWTPNLPFLTRISLTNLLVTPYTYSHKADDGDGPEVVNYLNYTNAGQNIGPSLEPNSDRIEIKADLKPISALYLDVFGRYILHGNASEGRDIVAPADGTVFDSGYTTDGKASFKNSTRFLTQSVLERTFQTGFDARLYYDTAVGQVQASLSYTFEYVANKNLTSSDVLNNYLGFGLGFRY
jgi:hypothetical protein